jgi:hypothetical protein
VRDAVDCRQILQHSRDLGGGGGPPISRSTSVTDAKRWTNLLASSDSPSGDTVETAEWEAETDGARSRNFRRRLLMIVRCACRVSQHDS